MPDGGVTTVKEVRFHEVDGPGFLTSFGLINEGDGNVCIAVYKENGIYALTRLSRDDFCRAVGFIAPEGGWQAGG